MASVASQLIEVVTAHAQSDSLEDAREICADGNYFPNNLRTIGKNCESLQRLDPLSHQRRRSKTLRQQHSHKDWYLIVHQTELITKQKWLIDRQPQRDSDLNVSFFYPEGVSSKVFRSRAAGMLKSVFKLYECEPSIVWNNKGDVEGKWAGWTWSGRGERTCRRLGED